jgi:hypothetical protein
MDHNMHSKSHDEFHLQAQNEKNATREAAEKYISSFLSRKRKKTVNEQFEILREFTITLSDEFFRLCQKFDHIEQIAKRNLDDHQKIIIPALTKSYKNLDAQIKRQQAFMNKFKGRKVSPANLKLYNEIDAADKRRIEAGEDSNWKQSSNVVVKDHKFTSDQAKRLYKNYIEWKNNQPK